MITSQHLSTSHAEELGFVAVVVFSVFIWFVICSVRTFFLYKSVQHNLNDTLTFLEEQTPSYSIFEWSVDQWAVD